jgi:hypothetical protein
MKEPELIQERLHNGLPNYDGYFDTGGMRAVSCVLYCTLPTDICAT